MNKEIENLNKELSNDPPEEEGEEYHEYETDISVIKEIQQKLKGIASGIEFIEKPHSYVRTVDGKKLTGITTIEGQLNKPYLVAWSTKENYLYMQEHWDIEKKYTKEEKESLLLEAKNAYTRKADKAKDIGTEVHKVIELIVKSRIDGTPLPRIKKELLQPVKEFLIWEKSVKPDWIATEAVVCSQEHNIAGTLDLLAFIDGELTLIDLKTSKMISVEFYLQTAGYQLCLEEFGIFPKRRIIIKLPKSEDIKFEVKEVHTPYEFDKEVFTSLISLKKWLGYCENNK